MKDTYQKGKLLVNQYTVKEADIAKFEAGVVHRVCSTFALVREMEWAGRLFVLEMKQDDEEGIGTMVHIEHLAPALPGDTLIFEARSTELTGNSLICEVTVWSGKRIIAKGSTGQKIIKKSKLQILLNANTHS